MTILGVALLYAVRMRRIWLAIDHEHCTPSLGGGREQLSLEGP